MMIVSGFQKRGTIRTFAAAAAALSATANADNFVFAPICDNVWQSCCPGGENTMTNNWNRTSPAPICPVQPTGADDVLVVGDCFVGPAPLGGASAGTLDQSAGTFTVQNNLAIGIGAEFDGPVVWSAGEIGRSGAAGTQYASLNGGLQIIGDADKTLSFFGGFRLINTGIGEWSGNGNWTIGMIPGGCCPAIFENTAGATFTVRNDATILSTAFGVGRFENAGAVVKDSSNGTSQWDVSFFNTGTVHVKTGTLRLTRAGEIGGTWNIDPGAQLQIAGNFFTLNPNVALNGRVVVLDSGTNPGISVDQPVTIDDLTIATSGIIGGVGLLSLRGTLTVEGGVPATPIRILPDAQLISLGSQRFGALSIAGAALLNAGSTGSFGGLLTVEDGGQVVVADGATLGNASLSVKEIINDGAIRKNATGGTATIASAFNWYLYNRSDGLIDVAGGVLDCYNRLDTAGEIHIAAGATFHQASWSNYRPGATFTGDGAFLLDSPNNFIDENFELAVPRLIINGTIGGGQGIQGPGTLRITRSAELRGGYCEAATTLASGAVLTVAGPNFTQTRAWENFGRVNVIAGGMNYFLPFNNRTGAVVDLQGDAPFGSRFGNSAFNNEGLLVKSAGAADTILLGTLNNSALVELRSGRIVVNTFNQTGGHTLVAGGGLLCGLVTLSGGELAGDGALHANISNVAGVVAPGNSAGRLELAAESGIVGDYSQAVGGSLRIQIGGMLAGDEHDQLVIARNASLGGGLNLQPIDGYEPNIGDSFVILTCGENRTGQFARVSGLNIGGGKRFNVGYNPHDVTVTVVAGGTIIGDADNDGHVTLTDLALVLVAFGSQDGQSGYNATADFDGDGVVGLTDLALLLTNFGL